MSFVAGSDRRDRWTLKFVDPDLEASFREDTLEPFRGRIRLAMFVNIPIWVVVALLGPPVVGVADPIPVYVICGAMVGVLLIGGLLTWVIHGRLGLELLGLVANVIAAIAVVTLATATGTFDRFAAVGLLFSTIIALNVFRLAFPMAVVLVVASVVTFTTVALTAGTAVVFQVFILASAVALGCLGTYLVEDGERRLFFQQRLIADLHRRVETLFQQYLSPDVARSLLEAPERADLGGETTEVTILFADLKDFTPFSERRSPHEVVAMLNSVFGSAVPIIFGEGGTIVQFVGDALMAIFNAPIRQPDHAYRAARAALRLQSVPPVAEQPRFRVGLNTGPALVGNIGSPELRNFTAIGDTTNVASRLQTFAEPGSVVISERTYRLIEPAAEVRELGAEQLKGRSDRTAVYELLGLREAPIALEARAG